MELGKLQPRASLASRNLKRRADDNHLMRRQYRIFLFTLLDIDKWLE
jgi:hypothetical protein